MKRLVSVALLAFCVVAAVPNQADAYGRCPGHQHWIAGHRDRWGHWVHGHCGWRH